MNKSTIVTLTHSFNTIVQQTPESDVEFWYARDLMTKLGYSKWQNFIKVVNKAKISCSNADGVVQNHFTDVSKMVKIGSGVEQHQRKKYARRTRHQARETTARRRY